MPSALRRSRNAEFFPALSALPGIVHAFTLRAEGIDVQTDRETALARLEEAHREILRELGLGERVFVTARQVHGNRVEVVDAATRECVPDTDGLITADPNVCLGIHVADCGAVYIVDPRKRVLALLHSGKKGTEQGITSVAIAKMQSEFGSRPEDLVVQLAPCIRPPHYEIDFALEIVAQARGAGVREVHDCGTCTACEPERYYSYRRELGRTGRMLALLAL
jgi:copper oxidase (laccase) domain-containing protein